MFFLLYISSFAPEKYSKEEASKIYSRLLLVGMFGGVIFAVPFAILADRVQPKYLLIVPFIMRALGNLGFILVDTAQTGVVILVVSVTIGA